MFRRRPFRPFRPLRRPAKRLFLEQLHAAHRMMERGRHREAAELFYGLAQAGARRRHPRAPVMFLQSGRALILAGDHQEGVGRLREGLMLMARMRQWAQLARLGPRAVEELRELGLSEQAHELESWLYATVPPRAGPSLSAPSAPRLPAKCPSCGGPVRPDQVEWISASSALCDYCGSVLEPED